MCSSSSGSSQLHPTPNHTCRVDSTGSRRKVLQAPQALGRFSSKSAAKSIGTCCFPFMLTLRSLRCFEWLMLFCDHRPVATASWGLADISLADVGRAAVVSLAAHACAGLILMLGGHIDAYSLVRSGFAGPFHCKCVPFNVSVCMRLSFVALSGYIIVVFLALLTLALNNIIKFNYAINVSLQYFAPACANLTISARGQWSSSSFWLCGWTKCDYQILRVARQSGLTCQEVVSSCTCCNLLIRPVRSFRRETSHQESQ